MFVSLSDRVYKQFVVQIKALSLITKFMISSRRHIELSYNVNDTCVSCKGHFYCWRHLGILPRRRFSFVWKFEYNFCLFAVVIWPLFCVTIKNNRCTDSTQFTVEHGSALTRHFIEYNNEYNFHCKDIYVTGTGRLLL